MACSEKAQLVERVKETFSLPVLEKKEAAPPPAEPAQGDAKAKDPKELEKLLKASPSKLNEAASFSQATSLTKLTRRFAQDLNLGGKGFKVYGALALTSFASFYTKLLPDTSFSGRDDIDKMTENLKSGGKFDKDDL